MSKDFVTMSDAMSSYDPSKNISRNILSRFEKCKIVGIRLEQLARGSPSTVNTDGLKSIEEICDKELKEKKIPFMISRTLSNGKKEYWRLQDMIIT